MTALKVIKPTMNVKLVENELVYAEFHAIRAGVVGGYTTSNIGIGLGGGRGGIGIGIGGSRGEMVANGIFQIVDVGKLLFTNKRIIFIGEGFVEIVYTKINVIDINQASPKKTEQYRKLSRKRGDSPYGPYRIPILRKLTAVSVLYEGGMDGEEYLITDKESASAKHIYETITGGSNTTQMPMPERIQETPSIVQDEKADRSAVPELTAKPSGSIKNNHGLLTTAGIVVLFVLFPPAGIPLMFKFMERPSTKIKIVISIVWGLLWLLSLIGSSSDTSTPQAQSSDQQSIAQQSRGNGENSKSTEQTEADDTLADALRKCTVMEAADIYTTGIGAKSGNVFNDGREYCNYLYVEVYLNDEPTFIGDVYEDWQDRKTETIDGKKLEYYLNILAW